MNEYCLLKYKKFLETGTKEDLEECSLFFNKYSLNPTSSYNNLEYGKCVRLTNATPEFKTRYYIHTHKNKVFDEMEKECASLYQQKLINEARFAENILMNMYKVFDARERKNCCNCVSIVIYLTKKSNPEDYSRYLTTVVTSVENIKNCLSDWIVRLYIDKSVFELIHEVEMYNPLVQGCVQNIGIEYRKILNKLFSYSNCEIYVTFCEKLLDNTLDIGKTRNFRFSGFFDDDVNINACREADGMVTKMDCHNLKVFENSPKLCLLNNFIGVNGEIQGRMFVRDGTDNKTETNKSVSGGYSNWLKTFKRIFSNMYTQIPFHLDDVLLEKFDFTKFGSIFDLAAGVTTLKCKFNNSYYEEIIKYINFVYDNYKFSSWFIALDKDEKKRCETSLNIGYDEILLMMLFTPIFGCDFNSITKITGPQQNARKIILHTYFNFNISAKLIVYITYDFDTLYVPSAIHDLSKYILKMYESNQTKWDNIFEEIGGPTSVFYGEQSVISMIAYEHNMNYGTDSNLTKFINCNYFLSSLGLNTLINQNLGYIRESQEQCKYNFSEFNWNLKTHGVILEGGSITNKIDILKHKVHKYKHKYLELKQTKN